MISRLAFDPRAVVASALVVLVLASTGAWTSFDGESAEAAQGGASSDSLAFAARLEERIVGLMERHGYPGFAVSVARECETVHAVGFGLADPVTGRAASPSTAYQIGSVTKMFTGLVLGTLVASGEVRLGDPLARYLPDSIRVPSDSVGATITLQHLALHLAGVPRYPGNLDRLDGDPIRGYATADLYEALSEDSLEDPVGSRWAYSNYGYGILGHALGRATGVSLERLVRDRITGPLGMDDTEFERPPDERLAVPYRDDDPLVPTEPWRMGELRGAGGMFSTVDDLARFAGFHLGCDGDVPETLRAGRDLAGTPFHRFPTNPEWAYGLGRFVIDDPELGRVLMHGGDVDGYAAYVGIALDRGVGVAFLTNRGIGRPLGGLGEWMLGEAVETFGYTGAAGGDDGGA